MKRPILIRIVAPAVVLGCYLWAISSGLAITGAEDDAAGAGGVRGQDLSVEEARVLLAKSREFTRSGQDEKAIAPLSRLQTAFPHNHIYLQELALIYGRMGRPQEEARYWEEFVRYAPMPVEGCPQLGQAYEKQQLRNEATDAFRRCIALDPNNPDLMFFLAHSLEASHQDKEASEIYEKGSELAPQYSDLRTGWARTQLHLGNVADGKAIVAKVLVDHPNDSDALLVMALACWREGNLPAARGYLEQAIRRSGNDPELHTVLGRVSEQGGDIKTAVREYETALRLSNDPETAQRLAALQRPAR